MKASSAIVAALAASMIVSGIMAAPTGRRISLEQFGGKPIPAFGTPLPLPGQESEPASGQPLPIRTMTSCGNNRKWVALTFDDGPEAKYGEGNLKELKALGVQATFYLSPNSYGYPIEEQCDQARKTVAAGHKLELHTMDHPHIPKLSLAQLDDQLDLELAFFKKCKIDQKPTQLRPPYGELLKAQAQHITDKYGLVIGMWNVESDDTEATLTEDEVYNNVVKGFETKVGLGNSAVVLMHDHYAGLRRGNKASGIITRVVNYFRSHGYEFKTADDCFAACNSTVCTGNGGPSPWKDVWIP